jgi:predicted glycosyltransferase
LDPAEPYVVFRLSAWEALHDFGQRHLSHGQIASLVLALRQHARPVVTAESRMPEDLLPFASRVPVEHSLDLLAFAALYVGEGGSMAAEAACLGTPAIFMSPVRCGYIRLLQRRYGVIEQTTDAERIQRRAVEWLTDPEAQRDFQRGHRSLLSDCDVPLDFALQTVDEYALKD